MILRAALIVPLLAVGLVSFIAIRNQQGQAATVVARQQVQTLTDAAVDRAVRSTPDPIGNESARTAHCIPVGKGALGNPWFCVLRYPTGHVIEYAVTINAQGSYFGDHQFVVVPSPPHADPGTISGCCIAVP